ncbi:PAS domain-containing hybrid sensor histidine kinase/response regulator [Tropicibacter naphthalenivorans]|uniref:histidine kinase n=1 Tax=Tropicibacter naphthalenivorans TaxID=441103 RepID=A0A0P1GE33_9RHOB|nr:PAS domain-containing hybrid sensor histidine kinase/response regulator [Tropicibacter naphthalenivorans]CUH79880.1 Autoinducer 2 sensor kinase/phosphatase LuxQ [Tropicibacter naphthalenivorans]SMC75892.1 PAS/PAC sensor hybrid histidine kinase [Tropicibacter naphthalenivorans]
MAADSRPDAHHLTAFEARYGRAALFDRYARVRIRDFGLRQIATLIGAYFLWVEVSAEVAMSAVTLALFGEFLELLTLRHARQQIKKGAPFDALSRRATIVGTVQAITIAVNVQIFLHLAPDAEAALLALCFLMAAAVNAGFTLTHHPPSSKAKLAVYALCAATYIASEVIAAGGIGMRQSINIFEVLMLGYLTHTFVSFSVRSWRRRVTNERALTEAAANLDAVNHDLAERQRKARELSLVASHANDAVIIFNPSLRITWVNEAFTRLTGYSFDEAVGRHPKSLMSGPESCPETARAFMDARREGRPWRAPVLLYRKDGRKVWFDINRVPVLAPDGSVETLISIERDVTEAMRKEKELDEAKLRAEEGARSKSVFLATMSHEIRTPLNAIIGMADLLTDAGLHGENKEYVDTIHSASQSLLTIINDVLEFSRLDADKVVFETLPFSPETCIFDAVKMMRPLAWEKSLYLDIVRETDLPAVAVSDEGRLRQILINLIGNAVKFTETGGVKVHVSAQDTDQGHALTVIVRDTGIGVPKGRETLIFEEFQQADAATTRRFGGTGLGLPISRALARRMSGDLVVLPDDPTPGTAFRLTVTLGRAAPDVVSTPPPIEAEPAMPEHMTVLLAEDNATNRMLVRRFLKDHPVTLIEATNGREAVELTMEHQPDAILMDMSMPELDGLAATRAIRLLDVPQPHIISLTANAFDSDREACAAAGMDDFVTKPVRRKQLIAALSRTPLHEKPLLPLANSGLSQQNAAEGTEPWTSPHASGTTSGKSIRSSDR